MIGHSTGGGEVARYLGRHDTGRVSIYPGAPHGMMATHLDQFDNDLLAFVRSGKTSQ